MKRDEVDRICATLPGAERSDPSGGAHDAWTVGGRMFACFGAAGPGVSVKCADIETADLLIAAGTAQRAPYFHRSWVLVPWGAEAGEMDHRLRSSYALIRAGLPKKVQAALAPLPVPESGG
jgi:predicted DNA-binding protein (MmcQ/YjbR family)